MCVNIPGAACKMQKENWPNYDKIPIPRKEAGGGGERGRFFPNIISCTADNPHIFSPWLLLCITASVPACLQAVLLAGRFLLTFIAFSAIKPSQEVWLTLNAHKNKWSFCFCFLIKRHTWVLFLKPGGMKPAFRTGYTCGSGG